MKDADSVIQKQGEIILLLSTQKRDLGVENADLTKRLLEMKDLADDAASRQLTYAACGVAVGIIAMVLIKR